VNVDPHLTREQLASLDPQVLEWTRSKDEGHLTRINDIWKKPDLGTCQGN